jgi:hypothetical protein
VSWYHSELAVQDADLFGVKIGPFSMVDMCGTPFSPALHVVERLRSARLRSRKGWLWTGPKGQPNLPAGIKVIDYDPNYRGKLLRLKVTVEDDGVFTTPWSAVVIYGRPLGEWAENVCAENVNKYNTENDPAVPTASKPDFWIGMKMRARGRFSQLLRIAPPARITDDLQTICQNKRPASQRRASSRRQSLRTTVRCRWHSNRRRRRWRLTALLFDTLPWTGIPPAPDTTPSWISTPKLEFRSQAPRCVMICTLQFPS